MAFTLSTVFMTASQIFRRNSKKLVDIMRKALIMEFRGKPKDFRGQLKMGGGSSILGQSLNKVNRQSSKPKEGGKEVDEHSLREH
jgi:hypothetical protein